MRADFRGRIGIRALTVGAFVYGRIRISEAYGYAAFYLFAVSVRPLSRNSRYKGGFTVIDMTHKTDIYIRNKFTAH